MDAEQPLPDLPLPEDAEPGEGPEPDAEEVQLPARPVVAPQSKLVALDTIHELENVRASIAMDSVSALAESIRVTGLLQPVVLRPSPPEATHGKTYELIVGYRRLAAFRLLEEPEIPAIVHDAGDEDLLTEMITENLQREDFSPMDEARAMQRLIATFGWTHAQVAAKLGVHRTQVTKRLGMLDLPAKVVTLLEEEKITPSHAEVIASMPTEDAQEELAELAVRTSAPVAKLASYASKIKADEDAVSVDEEVVDESTPLETLSADEAVVLPHLVLREDLTELDLARLRLYAQLRAFNDTEMLEYLDERLMVPLDALWDWVVGLDADDVAQMIDTMTIRWVTAAHRLSTLPEELRRAVGAGESTGGRDLDLPAGSGGFDDAPDYDDPDFLYEDDMED